MVVRKYPSLGCFSVQLRGAGCDRRKPNPSAAIVRDSGVESAQEGPEVVGGDEVGGVLGSGVGGGDPGRRARKWQVDVSTVIGIRRTVEGAALAPLAALARGPGRPARQLDWQLEAARTEIGQLTEAIKAQAIELAVIRGNPVGSERSDPGEGPRRSGGAGPQNCR